MTPALNKPLPEIEALATGGVKFTPQAFLGQAVVLYFYPKDNTPGCTTEACDFTENFDQFDGAGVKVLGISPDAPEALAKFRADHDLSVELLSDPSKATLEAYGAYGEKKNYGKVIQGVIRSTVVVDAAHNPHGAAVLAETLKDSFTFTHLVGVVSIFKDKDVVGILEALEPALDEIVVTRSTSPRAMRPERLGEIAAEAPALFLLHLDPGRLLRTSHGHTGSARCQKNACLT